MEILNSKSRHHPRVDLTAMVDLGFLLITFFMLASSMGIPKILEINKPISNDEQQDLPESKSLTLILSSSDLLYTYVMDDQSTTGIRVDSFSYTPGGLRSRIMTRQNEVEQMHGNRQQLFVLIKPLKNCSYKHMIDVLDEMRILQVARYAILEPNSLPDSVVIRMIEK